MRAWPEDGEKIRQLVLPMFLFPILGMPGKKKESG
jgi:hypothetical protein